MQTCSGVVAAVVSCLALVACEGLEPLSPKREALAGFYRLGEVRAELADGQQWVSDEPYSHLLNLSDSSSYYLTYNPGVYELEGDKLELFRYAEEGPGRDKGESWRAYQVASLTEDELVLRLRDPMSNSGLTSPLGSGDSLLSYEETWVRD